jgi:hypothetical protein
MPLNTSIKTALALVLALAAIAPAAASAKFDLNPPRTAPPVPAVQVVQASSHNSFDWSDAAIGAAVGIGLSLLVVGGVAIAGKRRHGGYATTP